MTHQIITSTTRGPGGWSETAVRLNGQLIAAITRPCKGAKYFRYDFGKGVSKMPFRTLKSAIASLELVK